MPKAIPGIKEFDLDGFDTKQQELSKNYEELRGLQSTLRTEVDNLSNGFISQSEAEDRFTKISDELAQVVKDIETGQNANVVQAERFQFNDYRSMLENTDYLIHESGEKYTEVDYRAYALFQMPINYDKHERGQDLMNLRNMHDAFLMINAMKTGRKSRWVAQQSPFYKELSRNVCLFDETLGHAMAGGNAGYGAEWLPTEFSAEFNELLRIIPTLSSKFQTWMMPTGASGKYPFQNGKAKVYKGSEALVDAAAQARKTNIATGNKTFSPELFIGALITSEELTEDALIDMVSLIRTELATAILEGLDSAIENGDTTSPHIDNNEITRFQTYDVETSFIGLRAMADDDSKTVDIETLSATSGVGALEVGNFMQLKGMMGPAGVNPAQCLFITGIKGRSAAQNALLKEDALGILQYIISGTLPTIDGSPVHISEQYLETLESDGFDGTDVDHTSLICVHLPSFRIAQRRGVTLEMNKDILTQQLQFVATARYDFGKVAASSIYPVACGINIQHT